MLRSLSEAPALQWPFSDGWLRFQVGLHRLYLYHWMLWAASLVVIQVSLFLGSAMMGSVPIIVPCSSRPGGCIVAYLCANLFPAFCSFGNAFRLWYVFDLVYLTLLHPLAYTRVVFLWSWVHGTFVCPTLHFVTVISSVFPVLGTFFSI